MRPTPAPEQPESPAGPDKEAKPTIGAGLLWAGKMLGEITLAAGAGAFLASRGLGAPNARAWSIGASISAVTSLLPDSYSIAKDVKDRGYVTNQDFEHATISIGSFAIKTAVLQFSAKQANKVAWYLGASGAENKSRNPISESRWFLTNRGSRNRPGPNSLKNMDTTLDERSSGRTA